MLREDLLKKSASELQMVWGNERDEKLIIAMRELFTEQSRTISSQGAVIAETRAALTGLSQQILSLSTLQESLRLDFNKRWDDLPKMYVPRAEQQAMGLVERTIALEEFRMSAARDISELKLSFQQQLQQAVFAANKEAEASRLAAKDDLYEETTVISQRQMTWLFSGITIAISILSSVALHFLK